MSPGILIVGTADTKADELLFMKQCVEEGGGRAAIMDVGVLGKPRFAPEFPNTEVAAAAGTTIEAIAALGDENAAMTKMAEGAVALALRLYREGQMHGLLALGGSMGTDLALDVTMALPLGMPKFVVSTVSYSHLIPPDRIAPDLMMILWAGGLYGLNGICRSILSQAAGAVLGACRAVKPVPKDRPMVAISSLGSSNLKYMIRLKPALEERGYEVGVFHSTGMGGQAIESLAAQGRLAAVLDLCLQEVGNEVHGSVVTSGPTRLEAAGRRGIPQIVAPGALDMIDMQTWKPVPATYAGRPYHAHNRLIASVSMTPEEREKAARVVGEKLARARGPVAFLLPREGIQGWDREGEPLHDPKGLKALQEALRRAVRPPVQLIEIDGHINDPVFSDAVLALFDRWVVEGHIPPGRSAA
ncbi:MAG: Tm-1-like ATP-binding domain-containing protein [Burkholderiales bacterium]|nr:Tm-1-like ATP-binding domain-containing protein [Burkholderiales bacterium]